MDLAVLKALADETRFAIYRDLATSTRPRSAHDLAERFGLHPNTVRLHLDRLRETGLVEVASIHRGAVGRPQHVYSLAPGAPSVGFDPPAHAVLAGLLGTLAEQVGADAEDAESLGVQWGTQLARRTTTRSCLDALVAELDRLGFDPAVSPGDGTAEGDVLVEFLHCPFRELAEAYPELVCNLHRGLCEGVVETVGKGSVQDFATLYDPEPCHVTVALR